jgi:transposase
MLRFRLMVKTRSVVTASSIRRRSAADHFGGLDVSVKETSIGIVDDTGRIVKEVKVVSEPEALLKVLGNPTYRFKRIGLEAGPLSQWLFSALGPSKPR